jgi:xylulokinase
VSVLTFDLGTSSTKAAIWSGAQLLHLSRAPIETSHPAPGRAEQDPEAWWQSVIDAAEAVRRAQPFAYAEITTIGFAAARETFACFDRDLVPVGPGILWSDARAGDQVAGLGDPDTFRRTTGVVLGPGCAAAKIAWVRAHEPERFHDTAWILAPRDLVVARLTGQVHTDATLASRTGLYDLEGRFLGDGALETRLPDPVPSVTTMSATAGAALGLPGRVTVVLGAGDRPCEAIGVGSSATAPMVSWGTTANVSVPFHGPASSLPSHAQVSRHVTRGFLLEAGLAAAGAAIGWLSSITGRTVRELMDQASHVPPGSKGVLALPWLSGARAPWWKADVFGAFAGLTSAHGSAELARALIEGIALDVARSIELLVPTAESLALAGGGADNPTWRFVIASVTGCDVTRRRLREAASVGARLLVAQAEGESLDVDVVNPIESVETPSAAAVDTYREVRAVSDRTARSILESSAINRH